MDSRPLQLQVALLRTLTDTATIRATELGTAGFKTLFAPAAREKHWPNP